LELATTRAGRHQILEVLHPNRSRTEKGTRRLRLMNSASA
jgi:hypothetical protein